MYLFRKLIRKIPGRLIHAFPLPDPEVTEGHQSRGNIGEICRSHGFRQVLLVTDRTLSRLGYEKAIVASPKPSFRLSGSYWRCADWIGSHPL